MTLKYFSFAGCGRAAVSAACRKTEPGIRSSIQHMDMPEPTSQNELCSGISIKNKIVDKAKKNNRQMAAAVLVDLSLRS